MVYPDNIRDYLIDLQLDRDFLLDRLIEATPDEAESLERSIEFLESELKKWRARLIEKAND